MGHTFLILLFVGPQAMVVRSVSGNALTHTYIMGAVSQGGAPLISVTMAPAGR